MNTLKTVLLVVLTLISVACAPKIEGNTHFVVVEADDKKAEEIVQLVQDSIDQVAHLIPYKLTVSRHANSKAEYEWKIYGVPCGTYVQFDNEMCVESDGTTDYANQTMWISNEKKGERLAEIIAHEMGHVFGYEHHNDYGVMIHDGSKGSVYYEGEIKFFKQLYNVK